MYAYGDISRPTYARPLLVFSERERSRSLFAVARPSVCRLSVTLVTPYSGGCKFQKFFYDIWYLGHPLTSMENFRDIVPGEPLRRGS